MNLDPHDKIDLLFGALMFVITLMALGLCATTALAGPLTC